MTFAEKLKVLRNSRELTKKALAKELNISVHTYTSWEAGRTRPKTKDKIQLISKFYRIPIGYFEIDEKIYNKKIVKKSKVSTKTSKNIPTVNNENNSTNDKSIKKESSIKIPKKKNYDDEYFEEELNDFFTINKDEKTLLEIMPLVLNKYSQFGKLINTELCKYFTTGKTYLSFIPFTIKKLSKIHIEKCSISTLMLCGFERYKSNELLIPHWIYPFLSKNLIIKHISSNNAPQTIEELIKQNLQYGNYEELYINNTDDTCIEYTIILK